MSVKYIFYFILLLGCWSTTGASELERLACKDDNGRPLADCYLLDVALESELKITGIIYRKERLGNKWVLQARSHFGTRINTCPGEMDEVDFIKLISKALAVVKNEHGGALDGIQFDMSLLNALWIDQVERLRSYPTDDGYQVEGKSRRVFEILQEGIARSTFVEGICKQVLLIGRVCASNPVSMNLVAFQAQYIGKGWDEIKKLPDAGIQKDSVWFSVDIK